MPEINTNFDPPMPQTSEDGPTFAGTFHRLLGEMSPALPENAPHIVDAILAAAEDSRASDIHLVPTETGLRMLWRIDGVLLPVWDFPRTVSANLIARLKVLAELLTYKVDVPQEGRIRRAGNAVEMRVSTFPTLYGEKGVVRLFAGSDRFRLLNDLGLTETITQDLSTHLQQRGGVLLITGPAGSGKTTTAYACLREFAGTTGQGRSLVSLEDPIEAIVEGVAQSQIKPAAGFDYATGLRSLMRQDPDVILVGEIRDRETAETVFQAALTGHLVITTFHAGSAAEALSRLADMDIEPYLLRSGIRGVLSQRLVRKLCHCAVEIAPLEENASQLPDKRQPTGCEDCGGTGFRDRMVIAEFLAPETERIANAILAQLSSNEIERAAVADGMKTRWDHANVAIAHGLTTSAEVRRAFGQSPNSRPLNPPATYDAS